MDSKGRVEVAMAVGKGTISAKITYLWLMKGQSGKSP